MASTTAPALICCRPVSRPVTVSTRSGETSSTMQSVHNSMPRRCISSMYRWAYSGPVSSCPKVWRPNPAWMHWFSMPPGSLSRSSIKMSRTPSS